MYENDQKDRLNGNLEFKEMNKKDSNSQRISCLHKNPTKVRFITAATMYLMKSLSKVVAAS